MKATMNVQFFDYSPVAPDGTFLDGRHGAVETAPSIRVIDKGITVNCGLEDQRVHVVRFNFNDNAELQAFLLEMCA